MKVKCLENGVIYDTAAQAARELGLDRANLSAVLNGRRNTIGGLHFIKIAKKEEVSNNELRNN